MTPCKLLGTQLQLASGYMESQQWRPPSLRKLLDCVWNVMVHAEKPDFFFWRNGRFHLNRQGRQFSRLLAAEVCASEVVMLDTPCSEVVWRVLANHSIRYFPLQFPSHASPCAIPFQLDSTYFWLLCWENTYWSTEKLKCLSWLTLW
jgi:hypothetical protein